MKTLNIILDSNIYWDDRNFIKKDFLLLKDLSKYSLIRLHIPNVVKSECLTKNSIEASEDLSKIRNLLRRLKIKGLYQDEIKELEHFLEGIEEFSDKIEDSTKNNWEKFIEDSNSILHEIEEEHGLKVINDYFEGGPPFKHRKNREDFPDAFIYQSIVDINEAYNDIVFLSKDKNLKAQVEENIGIDSFSSFEDFFQSEIYEPYKEEYENILSIEDEHLELRKLKNELIDNFEQHLYNSFYNISFQDMNLPYDNDEAEIQEVEKVNNIEWLDGETEFIDDRIHLTFNVELDALVEYYITKNDYHFILDEEKSRKIGVTDWNKHVYLAEESMTLELTINCSIPRDNIETSEFEINEVEVDAIKVE